MDRTDKPVIYKIINLTNAKFYVGSTVKWRTRVRTHRRKLVAGTHHCTPLQNAWNKYGEESFVFRIVAEVSDPAELHSVEQVYLNEHHGTEKCYNVARYTDNSNRGVVRSERHKVRISEALKQHYETNTHPRLNLPHSEESKALMRANRAGKTVSEETKAKLREANLGKRATAETRAKLSAMRKGKERTAEHAAKYNKAIVEVTSGQLFQSLKDVKEAFGLSPGMLAKALAADRPLIRGKNAGKHFQYAEPITCTDE
jgi:group I intron endonuclease